MEEICDLKPARRVFSYLGFALIVISVVGAVLQLAFALLPPRIWGADNWFSTSSTGFWIMTFLPIHGIAMPIGLLMLRRLPSSPPEKGEKGLRWLLPWIPVCFFLMYSGNIIGIIFSTLFSGGTATNNLFQFAFDSNPLKLLVMVVAAPFLEELIFRKTLIDKTRKYGEKWAIVLSGVLFGLFHMNFFQFFYAFFVGTLFAYIYVRSGRYIYVACLHSLVNFVGSVLAPWVVGLLDLEALESMSGLAASGAEAAESARQLVEPLLESMGGILAYLAFTSFVGAMFVWGLVLFIIKTKRLEWKESETPLPKGKAFKTVYLNAGMIIFIIFCLGSCIVNLFNI